MKRLGILVAVFFAVGICFAPCAFSYSVGDPVAPNSDILVFSMTGGLLVPNTQINPQIRTLVESPGENVTEEADLTIANTSVFDRFAQSNEVYLVDPVGATLVAGTTDQYSGMRSDIITFHISHENSGVVPTVEFHFTLNSDEEPGNQPTVIGYVENGLLQNITAGFGFGDLATQYGIQVLAGSDEEAPPSVPEPATLLLLGLGLVGLAGVRRFKK